MTCFAVCFQDLVGDEGLAVRMCRDFPHTSGPALEPTLPLYRIGTVSYPGVKRPGRDVDHQPHLALRFKKE
jgi:hypothetical protein